MEAIDVAQRSGDRRTEGLVEVVYAYVRTGLIDFPGVIDHAIKGWFPLILLERAGLARMRGDADGMARDLAEASLLFAPMGITGWDAYARSIEA